MSGGWGNLTPNPVPRQVLKILVAMVIGMSAKLGAGFLCLGLGPVVRRAELAWCREFHARPHTSFSDPCEVVGGGDQAARRAR